jgi:hypothetical protein
LRWIEIKVYSRYPIISVYFKEKEKEKEKRKKKKEKRKEKKLLRKKGIKYQRPKFKEWKK